MPHSEEIPLRTDDHIARVRLTQTGILLGTMPCPLTHYTSYHCALCYVHCALCSVHCALCTLARQRWAAQSV
jgi:hypothetical protein